MARGFGHTIDLIGLIGMNWGLVEPYQQRRVYGS
jgi:hypothetical protein